MEAKDRSLDQQPWRKWGWIQVDRREWWTQIPRFLDGMVGRILRGRRFVCKKPKMKLDLINSRVDPPPPSRVYDSLEDVSSERSQSTRSLVRMAPISVDIRTGSSKRYVTYSSDRFDNAIVNHKGDRIYLTDRCRGPSRVKKSLPVIHFDKPPARKDSASGTSSFDSSFLEEESNTDDFQIESSFRCWALDMLKDKVHDSTSYTVSARVASGKLPGAWGKAQRGIMCDDAPSSVGPGSYQITNVTAPTVPAITISQTGREQVEEVREDFLPLEKRLRLDRMRAMERKPSPESMARSMSSMQLDPLPAQSSSSSSKGAGTISMAPRFDGPGYRVESYLKTNGLLLGPDFDAKFDKRIPFDLSKSSIPTHSRPSSPVHDMDVDVDKYFSIQGGLSTSPQRYSACFRSKAEVGLQLPVPATGTIGPGSYPNAHQPSIQIHRPGHLSIPFRGTDKSLEVKKAAPDGTEENLPFGQRHTRGPIFTTAASPHKKKHLAAVAERKMSQIYPQLITKKSFISLDSSQDSTASVNGGSQAGSASASSAGSPGRMGSPKQSAAFLLAIADLRRAFAASPYNSRRNLK